MLAFPFEDGPGFGVNEHQNPEVHDVLALVNLHAYQTCTDGMQACELLDYKDHVPVAQPQQWAHSL